MTTQPENQGHIMDYSSIPINPKEARMEVNPYEEDEFEDDELEVPKKLNICQWITIGLLYLILAYLVIFIIYISATWSKDRTNEYT